MRSTYASALFLALLAGTLAHALDAGSAATPDSTNYVNAAMHLLAGHGYVTGSVAASGPIQLDALTTFPPGMSLSLASLMAVGVSPRAAAQWIASVSFVLYVLATFWLLCEVLPRRGRLWALPLSAVLMIHPSLRASLGLALSDLPGAALVVASAAVALRTHSPGRARSFALGSLLALSVCVRWANLYVAASAYGMFAVWGFPELTLRERARNMLRMVSPFALLIGPIWLRNLLLGGSLMGVRPLSLSDPTLQLGQALLGMSAFLEEARASLASLPLLVAVHTALAFGLGAAFLSLGLGSRDTQVRTLLCLLLGYALCMVLSSSFTHYDPLSDGRFWLATAPLGVALCVRVLQTLPAGRLRHGLTTGWALLSLHAFAVSTGHLASELRAVPRFRGYFDPSLDASPVLARALSLHDRGLCELATNEPYSLLPRIGTRPLRFFGYDELPELDDPHAPLCFVAVGAKRLPWTLSGEPRDVRGALLTHVAAGRFVRVAEDDFGELYRSTDAIHATR